MTSVSSQLTISQAKLFLNLNCTLYGFGWRARPGIISLGSRCVKISSEGFVTVQICIKVAKNKNARFFAKTSPMHARLPNPNINKLQKSKDKIWSLYPVTYKTCSISLYYATGFTTFAYWDGKQATAIRIRLGIDPV